MVMKLHGNVRGEVRVNFLALSASKPHNFMCGALRLSGIVRANVRLNIAIPMPFLSLNSVQSMWGYTEMIRSGCDLSPSRPWEFRPPNSFMCSLFLGLLFFPKHGNALKRPCSCQEERDL